MSKKIYNSQAWEVECYYINVKNDELSEIDADSIKFIQIVNTLESYVPTVRIQFIDKGYVLLSNLNTSRNIY